MVKECKYCGSKKLICIANLKMREHTELRCYKCGKFIKFANADEKAMFPRVINAKGQSVVD